MLEHQVIHPVVLDDQRETIEVLDARLELAAIEQVENDGELFPACVIEKDVLDVRGAGLRGVTPSTVQQTPTRRATRERGPAHPETLRGHQTM